jgi:hypothetical protein
MEENNARNENFYDVDVSVFCFWWEVFTPPPIMLLLPGTAATQNSWI